MQLVKGQNVALPATSDALVVAITGESGPPAVDISALLLDEGRKVLSDDHFVFYNQPTSPDGSVQLRSGASGHEVEVTLSRVAADVHTIAIAVSLDGADGRPAQLRGGGQLVLVVRDGQESLLRFDLPDDLTTESALVFGEVYRRAGAWKFRANGQGYASGLAGLVQDYGVGVDEEPPAASAAPATSAPVPTPTQTQASTPPPAEPPQPVSTRPAVSTTRPKRAAPVERPAAAAAAVPTLQQALPAIAALHAASTQVHTRYREAVAAAAAALGAAEPSLTPVVREVDQVRHALVEAMKATYGSTPTAGSNAPSVRDLATWMTQAKALTEEILTTRVPLTKAKRQQQMWTFNAKAGALLSALPEAERRSVAELFGRARLSGVDAYVTAMAERTPALQQAVDALPQLPAVIGSLSLGDVRAEPPVPGVGPLFVRVGAVRPGPVVLEGRRPIDNSYREHDAEHVSIPTSSSWQLPALLDVSRVSGLVTTSPSLVNATLLRLLSLLPAGQVKATLFDPVRLGDSAKFIFGLGDAAEQIIGDKVRSTDRELAEVLVGIEEHLTFVTQKYLQGQYETLTDYNQAAGEVAEPYRVLVLYDYPHGFVRPGGGPDPELLARLKKIIGAGKRCGVLTFVATSQPVLEQDSPLMGLMPLYPAAFPAWLASALTIDQSEGPLSNAIQCAVPNASADSFGQAARRGGAVLFSSNVTAMWEFLPEPEPPADVVTELLAGLERGLVQASDVRVGLAQVADLAASKLQRDVARGTRTAEVLPRTDDPSTWWHGSAADSISAAFGRVGATDIGALELDSQIASGALVGGRMGSGKSVLLHAIILSLVTRYGPDELSLYLVDFKEGVEFKQYASLGLPQARVVAVESDREFGLSVLQSLDAEITRRGALFRDGSGQTVNLSTYRARTGEKLPRVVLLVDEFHVLFNVDDKLATEAAELLDRIVRQGRAFGVHTILASQTLAGTSGLGKHTLGLIPIRIALQCSEADSRMLLADDNPDARLLTRPGEGILNTKGGLKDGNSRFQAAFSSVEEREHLLDELRSRADSSGHLARPVVFEGKEAAAVTDAPADAFGTAFTRSTLELPLGLPLTLDGPVKAALRREPGGNLLAVMGDESAYGFLTVALASLAGSGAGVRVLDHGPLDAPWAADLEALAQAGVTVARRHSASALLAETAKLVQERHDLNDLTSPPVVLVLAALHRAREFDTSSADGSEPDDLAHVLKDGPDVGVHVVAWVDKPVSLDRRLTSSMQREFSLRVLGPMSKDDSFRLIDSDVAATLNSSQVVLDDHDQVRTTRARRFASPPPGWAAGVARS